MGLPPYLYERPDRVLQRLLGASPPLEEVLSDEQYLARAVEALAGIGRGESGLPSLPSLADEVAVYHAMLAVAARTGSPRLVMAVVRASGDDARARLRRAPLEEAERYARLLGLPLERASLSIPWLVAPDGSLVRLSLTHRIGLQSYLRVAAGSEGVLSLPNSFLLGGRVYLDRSRLVELIALAVERRVARLIDAYGRLDLGKSVEEAALRVLARLEEGRSRLDLSELPACIRRIVEEGARSDEEAYMLVAFLASVKPSREVAAEILMRSGLAGAASVENLVDAVLGLSGVYPYRCDSPPGRRACPEGCGRGVLREYYRGRRRGRGRG